MVHERVLPASRLASLGRETATRAFDLCSDLRAIDRHHRRIQGVDHVVFDEDRLITHILDCVGALRRMQRLFDTSTESDDGGDDAADALQVAREAVFMKALHLMLSCDDGTDAVGAMVGAFPGFGDLTSSPSSSASSASASSSAPGAQKRSWQPVHWAMLSAESIAQASGRGRRASPRPRHHAQQVPAAATATAIIPPDVEVVRVLVDHDPSALVLSQFGADPSASLLGGVFIPHWQEQHTPADILVMQPAPDMEVSSVRDTAHGSLPTSFLSVNTASSPHLSSPSSSLHTHKRWCGSWGT